MDLMKRYPDKYFDLVIVDPPYFKGPEIPGYYQGTKQKADCGKYKNLNCSWKIVDAIYFYELFRVSKNQIIWGINYFNIALPGGRIIWIKGHGKDTPFSMAEIAYQSFYNRIDIFEYMWSGFWKDGELKEKRIHPTQKPIALYFWLLQKYAKQGNIILDTHVGSASSLIACEELGFDYSACEIDIDMYNSSKNRLEIFRKGNLLFD
jgi:site-specific DNA-methyltransferase (adenine-specific)